MIRHCFIEIDENGLAGLGAVRAAVAAGEIPAPSVVNESSPNKFHIIWNCEGLSPAQCKALNQALVKRFGADAAAVDANRVLRVPSFVNHKPAYNGFVVRTLSGEFDVYEPTQFKVSVEDLYDTLAEESECNGTPIEFNADKIHSILSAAQKGEPIEAGNGRHYFALFKLAGSLRHYAAPEDVIFDSLVAMQDVCVNHGSDYEEMCEHIAREIAAKPVGTVSGKSPRLSIPLSTSTFVCSLRMTKVPKRLTASSLLLSKLRAMSKQPCPSKEARSKMNLCLISLPC